MKMKNLVLMVVGADIQETVTGMVIVEIISLSKQSKMVMAEEIVKLVMEVAEGRPFLVMVVGEGRSFLVMKVAAQVGTEAIQTTVAADVADAVAGAVVDFAFDFELDYFVDIEDELVVVLEQNQ